MRSAITALLALSFHLPASTLMAQETPPTPETTEVAAPPEQIAIVAEVPEPPARTPPAASTVPSGEEVQFSYEFGRGFTLRAGNAFSVVRARI